MFTQTKQDANELAVSSCLSQEARVLHGDIVQKQRELTLKVRAVCVTFGNIYTEHLTITGCSFVILSMTVHCMLPLEGQCVP